MRDADVRAALMQRLQEMHRNEADTCIVQEMGVWSGYVRVDVAVINGELSGFEIKSDRDTLVRLGNQADIYSRVFDRVELVVGSRHKSKAEGMVPAWWGIIVASMQDGRILLTEERTAQLNPAPEPYLVAQLLWKEEAIGVLDANGLARGWRSKTVSAIHHHLAETLPFEELRSSVRKALKSRIVRSRQIVPDFRDVSIDAELNPSR